MKNLRELREIAAETGYRLVKLKPKPMRLNRKETKRITARLQSEGLVVVVKKNGNPAKVYGLEGYQTAVATMKKYKPWKKKVSAAILAFSLLWGGVAQAEDDGLLSVVSMDIVQKIESSGNPAAYNRSSKAKGLYQITPVVLLEYNKAHPWDIIGDDELFLPDRNEKVAKWYLFKRIPQMLVYFNKPVTVRNVLICYNAGINYVVKNKPLPNETLNYIQKYKAEIDDLKERASR